MKVIWLTAIANRRWLQLSLRSLLILVAALGIGLALWRANFRKKLRIDNAVRLIAASPNWSSNEGDPIALIRAVNALQALGKDEAIEVLRQFAAQYPTPACKSPIMFITPLLFDHADPEDRFIWDDDDDEYKAFYSNTYYSHCSIKVEQDIPFRYSHPTYAWGSLPDPNLLRAIDWAEKRGRLRSNPLRPPDNPLDAAESFFKRNPTLVGEFNKQHVRAQASRAVAPLLVKEDFGEELTLENDEDWSVLKEEVAKLHMRWSESRQTYEASP
jgi:hypothetical protein